jgi:hypothetical protein
MEKGVSLPHPLDDELELAGISGHDFMIEFKRDLQVLYVSTHCWVIFSQCLLSNGKGII